MSHSFVRFLLCVVLLTSVCEAQGSQSKTAKKTGNTAPVTDQKKVDVCKLLNSADIEGVQDERVEEAIPSAQPSSGLLMSQCLFRTSTPAKSVSIALAAPSTQKPKDYWRKQFHGEADEEKSKNGVTGNQKKGAQESEREEESKPRTIAGIGDEAFWVGGPISGALYVLRGNTFIRVSVGGVRAESARIEKSVSLARAALRHL
ncbi:MAG: hypothetical protein WA738_11930 [Candidatus Angelobacter sp.]